MLIDTFNKFAGKYVEKEWLCVFACSNEQRFNKARADLAHLELDWVTIPQMRESEFRTAIYSERFLVASYRGLPTPEIFRHLKKNQPPKPVEPVTMDARYLQPAPEAPRSNGYEQELARLVGMQTVKLEIERIANAAKTNRRRQQAGLPALKQGRNFILTGNPGTGKTTVARILAKALYANQMVPSDKFTELDRSMIVGRYIGHSETNMRQLLNQALGGTIYIDEFYSLAGTDNDFGRLIIDVIVKFIEDNRDSIAVIISGYTKEMNEAMKANSGLKSRFSRTIHIPDYSVKELVEIFDLLLREAKYRMTDAAYPVVYEAIKTHHACKTENFGNARDIRTFFEAVTETQSARVCDGGDLALITEDDVRNAIPAANLNGLH